MPGGGLLGADVAFPVLHGPFGEDGTVQGLLELLDVPYVGAGVLASSLCMDKIVFKDVLARRARRRSPTWRCASPLARRAGRRAPELEPLGLPLFVKPARLGSSVGIAKVRDAGELDAALDGAVRARRARDRGGVQRRDRGRVRGHGLPRAEASVPGEVVLLGGAEWYDYEAKYADGGVELRVPARIADASAAELRRLAVETFLRVGCAGLARVDFFVEDGGRVLVNELNTLPGMTRTSAFPKLWEAAGVPWPEACDRLLGFALERHRAERGGHASDVYPSARSA